nr:LysE family transporter [Kurthia senegalensis]
MGIRIFFSKPSEEAAKAKGKGRNVFKAYASTFLLTMTNPVTILSFLAIFSSLDMAKNESSIAGLLLVAGVFLGSVF